MDRWPDGPPAEAYSRVTDPGRFAPLHAAATTLLDHLEREYDVRREEGAHLDPALVEDGLPVERLVRLTPADAGAAPLVVAFTDFPGLTLRLGRWRTAGYPHCGCDACDEQVDELTQQLHDDVDALVRGRFTEELTRGPRRVLRYAITSDDGGSSGTGHLARARARALGPPGRMDWRPWPRRS